MRTSLASVEKLIIPVGVIVAWEALGRAHALPSYLSTPAQILAAFWEVSRDGELSRAVLASLLRVITGFALGTAAGMLAGLGAGLAPALRNFFDPLVSLLFAVPKIAFLPVFLILFGIGYTSKIAIVGFSCFFPVFIASRHAVLSVNKLVLWAAQSMGTPRGKLFFRVVIPAAAPELFAGVRISLAHAFIVLFAAELIGSHAGIGELIAEGENAARFDLMFAGIFAFAFLGFAGDRILMALRSRLLKGQALGTEELVP